MNVQANGLVSMATAVIVSAVIVGIVMIPIISNATTHTEIIDIPSTYNENPTETFGSSIPRIPI